MRQRVDLDWAQSMRLLATVQYGRVVFTRKALPAIHPVHHIVDDGNIIIRTDIAISTASPLSNVALPEAAVVAYQADSINLDASGWSVAVTGLAAPIFDTELISRYQSMLPDGISHPGEDYICIQPHFITGHEYITLGADPDPPK